MTAPYLAEGEERVILSSLVDRIGFNGMGTLLHDIRFGARLHGTHRLTSFVVGIACDDRCDPGLDRAKNGANDLESRIQDPRSSPWAPVDV
jgi:hypothetical protein